MSSNESGATTSRRRKLTLNKKTPSRSKGQSVKRDKDNSAELICTPTSAHIPIPKKSLRNLKSAHQSIETSDDSTAEIVWDNNSPSPSICAKPSKRTCKGGNNDISSMLKHVPRKKKNDSIHDEQGLKTWMQDDLAVVTYSAGRSSAKKNNRTLRTQTQRKKARKNKELVRAFQSLKSMMNNAEDDSIADPPNSQRRSPLVSVPVTVGDMNMSPINISNKKERTYDSPITKALPSCMNESTPIQNCIFDDADLCHNKDYVETPGVKKTHNSSEKIRNVACKTLYENNSTNVTDSLMNFDFDDDMEGCDSALLGSKESPAVVYHHPVHRESMSSKALFADNKNNKVNHCESSNKETISSIALLTNKLPPKNNNKNATSTENNTLQLEKDKNNDILMNIDFDDDLDDLDEFLTTQPCIANKLTTKNVNNENPIVIDDDDDDMNMLLEDPLAPVEKNECMISQNISILDNDDENMSLVDILDDEKDKEMDKQTEKEMDDIFDNGNVHTPKRKTNTNTDLIGFDDADDLFDDIVLSLDGDVKCKSQETPPQCLTSDQRKLKSRCHTSPFPLTSKRSLLKNECRTLDDSESKTISKGIQLGTSNEMKNDSHDSNNNNNNNNACNAKNFKEASVKRPPDKPTILYTKDDKLLENKPNSISTNYNNNNFRNSNNNSRSLGFTQGKAKFSFRKTVGGKTTATNSLSHKPPLDISIIGKKENRIEEEDEAISVQNKGGGVRSSSIFSSTQKCSMDEIQRKREEAQMKLKQRNQMKR